MVQTLQLTQTLYYNKPTCRSLYIDYY